LADKKASAKKSSGGGGGDGDSDGDGKDEQTDDMPDKASATDENDDKAAKDAGIPEISEEELAKQAEKSDGDTEKKFQSRIDTSEDFSDDQFAAVKHKGPAYILKIKRYGSIVELLEPRAR